MSKISSKLTAVLTRAVAERLQSAFRRYVLEEALAPFRRLGRRLAFGTLGALLIGTGSVVALVGLLRALQTETGSAFAGNYSFAPYLITAATGAVALGGFAAFGFRSLSGHARRGARRRAK